MFVFESEIVKLLKHCFFVRTFAFMHLTHTRYFDTDTDNNLGKCNFT